MIYWSLQWTDLASGLYRERRFNTASEGTDAFLALEQSDERTKDIRLVRYWLTESNGEPVWKGDVQPR